MLRPLAMSREGETVLVREIRSGLKLKKRLGELGLYEGTSVKIVRNRASGPVMVKVLDSQLILGRGESLKILVE